MTNLPEGLTIEDLRMFHKLDTQIKKAEARKAALAEKIKAAHPAKAGGTFVYEEIIVEIAVPDVLDDVKFERERPAKDFPELYKLSPDTKKIQVAYGKQYYIKNGGSPRLSVKAAS